ncbi:MAG: ABC transporter permease [Gemmatimonadetes bacterium]|nr:ABC transporter permease [Gemmatimonadota bacterium]
MSWTGDLRYVVRALRKSPTFTTAALATLALAIGATTAIFSAVNGILLRPLPFPSADRLVGICEQHSSVAGFCIGSPPNAADWAAESRTLEAVGIARDWPFLRRDERGSETIDGGVVSPDFFRVLGLAPALGRLISIDDMAGSHIVVLSHGLWEQRFGGDSSLVGRAITLDNEPYTVVGVLPARTAVPKLEWVQLWTPLPFDQRLGENRKWRGFQVFARMAPGSSIREVQQDLDQVAARLAQKYPDTNRGWTVGVADLRSQVVGRVERALLVLLGAVGFVLLIGCANVANLLLARLTHRSRDLAVRAALGADRWASARLIALESLVLAAVGGVIGLGFSFWALDAFVRLAPRGIPRLDEISIDRRVFGFAVALSCLTGLVFGAIAFFRASHPNPGDTLRGKEAPLGGRRFNLRSALVVAEVALALVLLTGAGLLLKSFTRMSRWDPGFTTEKLTMTWLLAPQAKYRTGAQVADLFRRAVEETGSVPGVVSAGAASAGPMFGGTETGEVRIVGQRPLGEPPTARWYDVDPNYFATMGIRVVRGRGFAASDVAGAPGVAVINQTMASRHWPGEDPIGRNVVMYDRAMTLVGVVADVSPLKADQATAAEIYWPNRQSPRWATFLILRTAAEPATVTSAARRRLQELDPDLAVSEFQTFNDRVGGVLVYPRFVTALMATFAGIALILAAIGVYGVIAYGVARRTREIGIQMALGAARGQILRTVIAQGMTLALVGVALGVAGSLAITPVLRSLLAGIQPNDPLTLATVALVLVSIAFLASYVPARRASAVSVLEALRIE